MLKTKELIEKFLSCPVTILGFLVGVSAFSLAAAYASEIVFGLKPCPLCIYQRIPFALVILLGSAGLILHKNHKAVLSTLALSGLALAVNSAIAFYHTGVERHWWASGLEGCKVSFEDDPQKMLDSILATQAARCDEIPWADPVLGLSMANYNVLLCLGLTVLCLLSFLYLKPHPLR